MIMNDVAPTIQKDMAVMVSIVVFVVAVVVDDPHVVHDFQDDHFWGNCRCYC